ncbi:TPA: amino acid adenylation domain-containing protein [Streptococcus agalactiae]|nr:amino acid adenylation domain-containing protein [Streptococcus agalactiae]
MEKYQIRQEAVQLLDEMLQADLDGFKPLGKDNLIEKGLSSIQIMQIVSELKKIGIKLSFAKLMENPTLEEWIRLIEKANIKNIDKKTESREKNISEEFPLTDVQYAYFVGREEDQVLGGVGCHAYLEIDGREIVTDRLTAAWNCLQMENPMLRAKFNRNGTQQIMEEPYSKEVKIFDYTSLPEEDADVKLLEMRKEMSHRKFDIEVGEVASLSIALLKDKKYRIFLDVDILIADIMSIGIIMSRLAELYCGEDEVLIDSNYTFKDYLEERKIDNEIYEKDKGFWKKKIESSFPLEAPNLPLSKKPEMIEKVVFSRRKKIISKENWTKIKENAYKNKVTPSMVLLSAYSMIIERWTNQEKFVINVPLFNRDANNNSVKRMVADFTNLLLVECERKNENFLDRVKTISSTFLENASHSSYSGVQVQRDVYKKVGKTINIAPVVFACNIDYPLETQETRKIFGKINYMVSQTPQVWLDFQTYLVDDEIVLCWDVVDELYPDGMIDDMFESLYTLLQSLNDNENWYRLPEILPLNQIEDREKELKNILPLSYPKQTLYTEFLDRIKVNPEKVAIVDAQSGIELTYGDLYKKALIIATNLISFGVKKNDYVGITLPRGYSQIVGILGILFAGAAYVPIGINQPNERRRKIYEQIGIKHVLSNKNTIRDFNLDDTDITFVDMDQSTIQSIIEKPVNISPFDTAYVIMTSGTTGIPKGVEIAHNSAVNTINDLNERYEVNTNDSVIMVSAIDFDLSVYDIFGILSVGGTIITLDDNNFKDPELWLKLIEKYEVTMWDSVPILFDMLVTMAEGKNVSIPLRLVFLSGDWIATTLPKRFYNRSKNSLVVGMGGGTEASIWSNYINIPKEIPKNWISIPYGKALKNQVYRVVDGLGRICPNYVKGELLIGGVGVAKGYRGDKELTEKKFVESDGVKWYRTGDAGRTWNDGTIEFLGRLDNQVKVKGHRIELGEIEDALIGNPKINKAVVDVIKIGTNNQLVAFIESNESKDHTLTRLSSNEKINKLKSEYIDYDEYLNSENNMVLGLIFSIFMDSGISQGKRYSFDEIMKFGEIDIEYELLVKRWLLLLQEHSMISLEDGIYLFKKIDIALDTTVNLDNFKNNVLDIIQGKKQAIDVFYASESKLSPSRLLKKLKNYRENINELIETIKMVFDSKNKKLKILDIGGRNSELTEELIINFEDKIEKYVYMDTSLYFANEFEGIKNKYNCFEFIKINSSNKYLENFKSEKFDIIILYNSLHRSHSIPDMLHDIKTILSPKGVVIGTEITDKLLLPEISASVLEYGFKNFDLLERNGKIIPSARDIQMASEGCKYRIEYLSDDAEVKKTGNMIYVLRNNKIEVKQDELTKFLKNKLPEYMIPFEFVIVGGMPLNKNGKIDRKELRKLIEGCDNQKSSYDGKNIDDSDEIEKSDEITIKLVNIYKEILNDVNVSADSNYFQLGGDSLSATKIVSEVQKELCVQISIGDIFKYPVLRELSEYIKNIDKKENLPFQKIVPDVENINEPFALTDVQFAYWMGRNGMYSLGSVATHCYFELDCLDIKPNKLQKVINDMIKYHSMLRAVILNNGMQQILKKVPPFMLDINNLSCFSKVEQEEALKATRDIMSHEVLKIDKWPVFNFKISILNEAKSRLHISLDNIILDGWSMFHILNEIKIRYDNACFYTELPDISFRDYVLAIEAIKKTPKYERDKKYWMDRLNTFLEAPKFKIVKLENEIEKQTFNRREKIIDSRGLKILKTIARENNITLTILLIALFSETLRKYTLNDEFVLNITQFNKEQLHPDINKIVGDFTTLSYLEVRKSTDDTLLRKARMLQKQLVEDTKHNSYSAVEFGRELRIKYNNDREALMPIVFTSGLGLSEGRKDVWLGELVYSISQTPQVWLDHQVMEMNGNLKIIWDSIDEIFTAKILDEMFGMYGDLLDNVINDANVLFSKVNYKENKDTVTDVQKSGTSLNYPQNMMKNSNKGIYQENEGKLDNNLLDSISEIWKEILKVEEIKKEDNFFELGGNSLNMIQLSNTLMERYNFHLELGGFMETPSIENLVINLMNFFEIM